MKKCLLVAIAFAVVLLTAASYGRAPATSGGSAGARMSVDCRFPDTPSTYCPCHPNNPSPYCRATKKPKPQISGTVFATCSDSPCGTARVGLQGVTIRAQGRHHRGALRATSGEGGRYTIAAPADTYTVSASGSGLRFTPSRRTVSVGRSAVSGKNFNGCMRGAPARIAKTAAAGVRVYTGGNCQNSIAVGYSPPELKIVWIGIVKCTISTEPGAQPTGHEETIIKSKQVDPSIPGHNLRVAPDGSVNFLYPINPESEFDGTLDANRTSGRAHAVFNRGPCTAGFRLLKLKSKT